MEVGINEELVSLFSRALEVAEADKISVGNVAFRDKIQNIFHNTNCQQLSNNSNPKQEICLDKDTLHYKQNVANAFAELVYDGKWYTPLREALSAFVDSTQEYVTGDVKLKLYKGNIIDAGVTSPYSLYDEEIATFDEDQVYDQNDSAGFINLFGLPIKVRAKKGLIK